MALQKNIAVTGPAVVHDGTVTVPAGQQTIRLNAYVKVESLQGTKNEMGIVASFTDGSVRFDKVYSFAPSLDGENFIKQAYEYLKTLPEFADAIDC